MKLKKIEKITIINYETTIAKHKAYEKVFDEMHVIEKQFNDKCYASEEHKEDAKAFIEKRKPIFKGK